MFATSRNSQYYCYLSSSSLHLFHNNRVIKSWDIAEPQLAIIGIGNSGQIAIRSPEGNLMFYYSNELVPFMNTDYNRYHLGKTSLEHVMFDESGKVLCLELLNKGRSEILFLSINDNKKAKIWQGNKENLLWDISPDFSYLATGEKITVKNTTHYKINLLSTKNRKNVLSVETPVLEEFLKVSNQGFVFSKLVSDKALKFLLVTPVGHLRELNLSIEDKKMYDINGREYPLNNYKDIQEVLLGQDLIAFRLKFFPAVFFKNYANEDLKEVNLSPLSFLKMNYFFTLNSSDMIDFIYKKKEDILARQLVVPLGQFVMELGRWEKESQEEKIRLFHRSEATDDPESRAVGSPLLEAAKRVEEKKKEAVVNKIKGVFKLIKELEEQLIKMDLTVEQYRSARLKYTKDIYSLYEESLQLKLNIKEPPVIRDLGEMEILKAELKKRKLANQIDSSLLEKWHKYFCNLQAAKEEKFSQRACLLEQKLEQLKKEKKGA